jgi:hypothetical protein
MPQLMQLDYTDRDRTENTWMHKNNVEFSTAAPPPPVLAPSANSSSMMINSINRFKNT